MATYFSALKRSAALLSLTGLIALAGVSSPAYAAGEWPLANVNQAGISIQNNSTNYPAADIQRIASRVGFVRISDDSSALSGWVQGSTFGSRPAATALDNAMKTGKPVELCIYTNYAEDPTGVNTLTQFTKVVTDVTKYVVSKGYSPNQLMLYFYNEPHMTTSVWQNIVAPAIINAVRAVPGAAPYWINIMGTDENNAGGWQEFVTGLTQLTPFKDPSNASPKIAYLYHYYGPCAYSNEGLTFSCSAPAYTREYNRATDLPVIDSLFATAKAWANAHGVTNLMLDEYGASMLVPTTTGRVQYLQDVTNTAVKNGAKANVFAASDSGATWFGMTVGAAGSRDIDPVMLNVFKSYGTSTLPTPAPTPTPTSTTPAPTPAPTPTPTSTSPAPTPMPTPTPTSTTPAPTGASFNVTLQPEALPQQSFGNSIGFAYMFWSNGAIVENVTFPATQTYKFTISARCDLGTPASGANMVLQVDGNTVATKTLTSNLWAQYTIDKVAISSGAHKVAVAFTNAGSGRALYVDSINIVNSFVPVASADGATATPGTGTLYDKALNTLAINTNKQIVVNSKVDTNTNGVTLLVAEGGVVYQTNGPGWWKYTPGAGYMNWTTTSDPRKPVASANGVTAAPGTGILYDSALNALSINATKQIVINGKIDTNTSSVTLIVAEGGAIYQTNGAGWWKYTPGAGWNNWTAVSGDPRPPTVSADGTTATPGTGVLYDAALVTYSINASKQVVIKGVIDPNTNNVALLLYKGGAIYQNVGTSWWKYTPGAGWNNWTGVSSDPRTTASSPPPSTPVSTPTPPSTPVSTTPSPTPVPSSTDLTALLTHPMLTIDGDYFIGYTKGGMTGNFSATEVARVAAKASLIRMGILNDAGNARAGVNATATTALRNWLADSNKPVSVGIVLPYGVVDQASLNNGYYPNITDTVKWLVANLTPAQLDRIYLELGDEWKLKPADVAQLNLNSVATARAAGWTRKIIVSCGDQLPAGGYGVPYGWAGGLVELGQNGLKPIQDPNVYYGFHFYNLYQFQQQGTSQSPKPAGYTLSQFNTDYGSSIGTWQKIIDSTIDVAANFGKQWGVKVIMTESGWPAAASTNDQVAFGNYMMDAGRRTGIPVNFFVWGYPNSVWNSINMGTPGNTDFSVGAAAVMAH